MPLDCTTPPNDFLPTLIGEFVEARDSVMGEKSGIINSIKLATKERLKFACNLSAKSRIRELNTVVSEVQAIERDILMESSAIIDEVNKRGFMRWRVGNGRKNENPFFERVFKLYGLRYGKEEMDRLIQIFSEEKNDGRFFLYVEYAEAKKGSWTFIKGAEISIRKIFLVDTEVMEKEKERESNTERKSDYFEPIA